MNYHEKNLKFQIVGLFLGTRHDNSPNSIWSCDNLSIPEIIHVKSHKVVMFRGIIFWHDNSS